MSIIEKAKAWLRQHPRLAAAAGLGGAFVFLKSRGGTGEPETAEPTAVVGVVPTDESIGVGGSEGLDEIPYEDLPPESANPVPGETPDPIDAEIPDAEIDAPDPAAATAVTASPTMQPGSSAITVSGRSFPGATGRQQVGGSSDANGQYTIWLISYPNRSERWYHYFKSRDGKKKLDKWTGPHNATGNSAGTSGSGAKPTTSSGGAGTGGGGGQSVGGNKPKCSGEYPYEQDTGPRKGECYKLVFKDGWRWRYYRDGDMLKMGRVGEPNAGAAPAATAPAPSAPAPAPKPAPAPAPAAPAPAPKPAPEPPKCGGDFPYHNAQNGPPSTHSCYKLVMPHGERWHYYADGHKVRVK